MHLAPLVRYCFRGLCCAIAVTGISVSNSFLRSHGTDLRAGGSALETLRESSEALPVRPSEYATGVGRGGFVDWDTAIRTLRRSVQGAAETNATPGRQAALWNDLALAQYESSKKGNAVHLVAALDSVERAWRLEHTPEIAWTRAALLGRLNLRTMAIEGWSHYLELDRGSLLIVEARNRLAKIRAETEIAPVPMMRVSLRGDSASSAMEQRWDAASYPAETRRFGEEELLGTWAAAYVQSSLKEAETLRVLRVLSKDLQAFSGESLLVDVVASIDRTSNDPTRRRALADAILQYRSGKEAYDRSEFSVAARRLKDAEGELRAVHSPLASLANVYRSAALCALNRHGDVISILVHQESSAPLDNRYYAARGLRHWVLGLAYARTGQLAEAMTAYEHALAAFERTGEKENIASTHYLRSDILDSMTDTDEGWNDRLAAQKLYPVPSTGRPIVAMAIALAAVRDHYDYAADAVLAELEADARQRDDASWMMDISLVRAVARSRIEDSLTYPGRDASRIQRTTIATNLLIAGPHVGSEFQRASIHRSNSTMRGADTRSVARDFASADSNLVTALTELERQARDVPSSLMRALFAERAQSLLVLASDVEIMRDRHVSALWLSDRARQVAARTFGAHATEVADAAGDAERLGREMAKAVPAGVTVVHQDLRSDQLRTWVIRGGKIHFVATRTSAATLASDIEQFCTRGDILNEGKHLYTALFGPIREYMSGTELLVYSPAPALRGVPLPALHDGAAFLIERRPLAVTPSISTFIRERPHIDGGSTALITLPSASGTSPYLPGASYEAAAVAKTYGMRGTALIGTEATPVMFLQMVPQFNVIHLGTHGHADGRPLQSGIEFGSEQVRAWQIMTLRLPLAPVVVLASCRTDDESEGRTTITLSSAFIAAGASAVVGSLWAVEDRPTARLMIDFHRHLSQGVSPAESLALAQKAAIARHEDVASWAAFRVQM